VLDVAANVGSPGKVTGRALSQMIGTGIVSRAQTSPMQRIPTLVLAVLVAASTPAQQIALDWATEVVPANNRVKTASDGGVFALGTGDDSAVIQRLSTSGTVQWTKTLSAPSIYAIDMDVDGSDNIYISVGFSTGQLDLDPGPNTTLVDPGKVYSKYNSNGQFQWGFSIGNTTDLSEDYSGISCDGAGNFYICGDLGLGTYDFDFGPGVNNLTVGDFSTGSYMARYRPDGSLVWANIETYYSGFCSSRDIAAMQDGSSFFVVRNLDNGGSGSSQIDVDYGSGVHNVYTDTQHILRYDSAMQFMAEGDANYGDVRLCADAAGSAYMMAQAQAGAGFSALKYNQSGEDLDQVYTTPLLVSGNLRLGDIAPDEQGGCLGMYSNNGPGGVIRFYKMNVSGLVDFNLTISCGNDYTYPGGKGFDLDGSGFYMGTYNSGHPVDFDPGPGVVSLPASGSNDGVVAHFDWCAGAPYDPFEIFTPGALCVGQPTTFTVSAFGDASSYDWTVPVDWTIVDGQGTATITVEASIASSGAVSVAAVNECGTSAPIALDFGFSDVPLVDLGPDQVICPGNSVVLDAGVPGASYEWTPDNGEFTQSITVSPTNSTTYAVIVSVNGCSGTDQVTIVVDPCLGIAAPLSDMVKVWPVPVVHGGVLNATGLGVNDLQRIVGSDGREWPVISRFSSAGTSIDVSALPSGSYVLLTHSGQALRFTVID
jgi:hypothetical protein